ncbi:hypothetical protein NKR19_g5246 [Coniochaeta hoffmannii]|uniref:Uncharacterized protein n=1 Tax=Coniochaeta hoffmannii TaxID=91930 RepID=A0AA38RLL2_9PEZI|nr:hypothetical protein NKR19_g5246 [Coniochaeta hoffmannii]
MPKDKQEPDTRNVDFTGKTDFTRNTDYQNPANAKEAKQMLKDEEKQARAEHSNSGSNTHGPQGMEYVPRKNHAAEVPHNR